MGMPEPIQPAATGRRLARALGVAVLALAALVTSGLVLDDHFAPRAGGAPSWALPVQPAQTALDRELAPLLAQHPGQTGALLLSDGRDAFAARAMAAQKAGRSLDLQYYIWKDDLTGHLLAREAWAAAERGVRVRILLDDLNAAGLDPKWLALDGHPRIELRLYNPFRNREGPWRTVELVQRAFSINHRMHNKAWIADGRVAIIGGRNIGEEYFSAAAEVNFRDLDLLLFGPEVAKASAIFDAFWNSPAAVPIERLDDDTPGEAIARVVASFEDEALEARAQPYLDRVAASPNVRDYLREALSPIWSDRLEIVSDPPMKQHDDDRDDWLVTRLLATLRGTRDSLRLISPYFVPGAEGSQGMTRLVAGGARVGVVTNSLAANDVPAVHSGYARYREALLRGGVQLHEMRARAPAGIAGVLGSSGASLHTKAFVVDGRRGFVGSFNLDPRSANLNTEMGVLFDDPALAAAVREEYERLAAPEQSYAVFLDDDGQVRWRDGSEQPARILDTEPDASFGRRAFARVLRWLPIESQL